MGDFHQEGVITDLHGLYQVLDREEYLSSLERKLESYAQRLRISLLLPCLHEEVRPGGALERICQQIQGVGYLRHVVVALGGARDFSQFQEARELFSPLSSQDREVAVVWVDGRRIQQIFQQMASRQIHTGVQGKGQSVWIALGYLFARGDSDVIGLHDCDVLGYDRVLLGRLLEPTANPHSDFEFCKGYYPRISRAERAMKGRVTRLFVVPFVDAMAGISRHRAMGELERFFLYHRAFKYPLAGEVSFLARLARGINIACDWGLEVSTLSEVFYRVAPRKVAQIDLAANYEHKEQQLRPEEPSNGLRRMVVDIAKFYLNHVRAHGMPLDDAFVDMIRHTYYQRALVFIKRYSDDAEVNGLRYDRHREEMTARHFQDFLWEAWQQCQTEPGGTLIPSWNRVLYSFPEVYESLMEAVKRDNLESVAKGGRKARLSTSGSRAKPSAR